MKNIVNKLIINNETIACMESCTGGMLASEITNIDGASNVFELGIVTYSNEQKIKYGIEETIIKKYTVYSVEVANDMAKQVCKIANSTYGIGITR